MGRIIVIDGTSNAGKTTLCENLQKNIENVIIIPGASTFVKQHQDRYPNIPPIPKTIEEEKINQEFFFRLELDRLIEAIGLLKNNVDVFMDRSVLEILSVAYSFESINNWPGIYSNAQALYNRFVALIKERGLRFPDSYIWLQASPEEVIRRNTIRQRERGQKLSENEWVNSKLIMKQSEFFEKLCNLDKQNKFKMINTNNKTKEDVLNEVSGFLRLKRKEIERNDD